MSRYTYNGPIMQFGICLTSNWKGETSAPSKEKAKSNLEYQYKKQNNLIPGASVQLSLDKIKVKE